jgi:hypothetical protein
MDIIVRSRLNAEAALTLVLPLILGVESWRSLVRIDDLFKCSASLFELRRALLSLGELCLANEPECVLHRLPSSGGPRRRARRAFSAAALRRRSISSTHGPRRS